MFRTLIQIGGPLALGQLICAPFCSDENIQIATGVFLAILTDIGIRYYEAQNNMDNDGWKWLFNKYYGMVLPIIHIPVWLWLLVGLLVCIQNI